MLNVSEQNFDFVGWVPCISGSLNFEYTACGIGDGYANVNHIEKAGLSSEPIRYIVVSSQVNWKDFKTASDGHWDVVLIASGKEEAESLLGKVFLIPAGNDA